MFVVYLLTREDQKQYVGIAKKERYKQRYREHGYTDRFKNMSYSGVILYEAETYEEIREKETFYVSWFDSYNKGLNNTKDGSGNNYTEKFTTLGLPCSKETKRKISEANKGHKRLLGKKKSIEHCKRMSEVKKGHSNWQKLTNGQVIEMRKLLKETRLDNKIKLPNGRFLTEIEFVARNIYKKYGVTKQCIRKILKGETWSNVKI